MSTTLTAVTVYTIGYQGVSIDEFVRRLKDEGIEMIVDVRAVPFSRKPGFSKNPLSVRLAAEGISYRHFPSLGIPSRYRKELEDYESLFLLYEMEILPNVGAEVARVTELCRQNPAALLCFEANPAECHRSRLAKYMSGLYDTKTEHIRF